MANRKDTIMKKITAMLIALTMAALTLTGCSSDEGSSSVTEQNVSGLSSENETFVTTSTTEEVTEESTEEDNSLITADTREELAKGLLEAICASDKDTVGRYGFSNKAYNLMQDILLESKEKAGLNSSDEVISADFNIYLHSKFDGSNYHKVDSEYNDVYVVIISEKLSSLELKFTILYDDELEKYIFKSSERVGESADEGFSSKYETIYDYHYDKFTQADIMPL